MAATIDFTQYRGQDGTETKRRRMGTYTGPVSYSNFYTNSGTGDPVQPGDVGLGQIHQMQIEAPVNASGAMIVAVYIPAAQGGPPVSASNPLGGGVIWFTAAGAEQANGANLSGYTAQFEAIGL